MRARFKEAVYLFAVDIQLHRIALILLADWNHAQRCYKRNARIKRIAVCWRFLKLQLCRVDLRDWQGELFRLAQAVVTYPATIVWQADFYRGSFNTEPELGQ